jgi:hypothetical protein
MNLKDTFLKTVASQRGEILQNQRDELLAEAEVRMRKIAAELAARIRFSLLISASIITGGLLVLSASFILSR